MVFLLDSLPPCFSFFLPLAFLQSAFIPYVTQMAGAGKAAVKDPPQFFVVYPNNPAGIANANELNHKDVKFLGSMGIIGIFAYGLAFIGAIAFMQFALRAFRTGNPHHRNAAYYRSRLTLYSFLLFLAGMVQILVGSFATKFNIIDNGRIAGGIVFTAMFVVQYPYLSIAVGIAQFLCGFWGFVRSFGVFVGDENDNYFQYSIALLWLITLTCQDIVQISLLPGGMLAPAAPTFAALSLGLHLMPAFLEYKMRSTPEEMDEAYYFAPESDTQVAEKRPIISRGGTPKRPLELRRVYVMERDAVVDVDEEDFYDGADGIDGQNAMQYVREGQQSI